MAKLSWCSGEAGRREPQPGHLTYIHATQARRNFILAAQLVTDWKGSCGSAPHNPWIALSRQTSCSSYHLRHCQPCNITRLDLRALGKHFTGRNPSKQLSLWSVRCAWSQSVLLRDDSSFSQNESRALLPAEKERERAKEIIAKSWLSQANLSATASVIQT